MPVEKPGNAYTSDDTASPPRGLGGAMVARYYAATVASVGMLNAEATVAFTRLNAFALRVLSPEGTFDSHVIRKESTDDPLIEADHPRFITRAISRSVSRFLILSRLSCFFFPRPRPSSILIMFRAV